MLAPRQLPAFRKAVLLATLFSAVLAPPSLRATEKTGMPDLSQIEQTCLPTSTANLLIWFGHHGYPKLISAGDTPDERDLRTVHAIMETTDARFDWGTRMSDVTSGIEKYIRESGYSAEVEYRGVEDSGVAFNQDWLQENDAANKGFILVLAYGQWNPQTGGVTLAPMSGHAVTLVNATSDMLLVHDPSHLEDEPGRKILTPHAVPAEPSRKAGGAPSPSDLIFLTGSLLQAPPGCQVILLGAVCITMHPADQPGVSSSTAVTNSTSANSRLGSTGPATTKPASTPTPWWWNRLYEALF